MSVMKLESVTLTAGEKKVTLRRGDKVNNDPSHGVTDIVLLRGCGIFVELGGWFYFSKKEMVVLIEQGQISFSVHH